MCQFQFIGYRYYISRYSITGGCFVLRPPEAGGEYNHPRYLSSYSYHDSQSADNSAPLFWITVHGAVFAVIDIIYAPIQIK